MSRVAKTFKAVWSVRGLITMATLLALGQTPALAVQSVLLTWNPSTISTVVGYKIYTGSSSRVYSQVIDAGNATNVTISGLADGSTNYFSATTYDAMENESAYSTEVVFVAPVAVSPPVTNSLPTNSIAGNTPPVLNEVTNLAVAANPAVSNSVILSWNASLDAGVAGYKVYYGPASLDYTNVIDAGLVTNLTIYGLAYGSTNYFAATEYATATNESAYSTEVVFVAPAAVSLPVTNNSPTNSVAGNPPPQLNTVSNLVVTANPALTNSVILSWSASTDTALVGYKIYYGPGSQQFTNATYVGLVTNLVIYGLATGSTNYFAATEYDAATNESTYYSSQAVYVVPVPALPALRAVVGLTVAAYPAVTNSVVLSWPATTDVGVTGYQVFMGKAAGNYTNALTVGLVKSLVISGLVPGTTNYFAVREYRSATSTGALSATVNWFIPMPVNPLPTLAPLPNLVLNMNSGVQTVTLSGISYGPTVTKVPLKITVAFSNPKLVTASKLTYISPKTSGVLSFMLGGNQTGTTTVTVTLNNGAKVNNLISRSFTVTVVNPVVIAGLPRITSQYEGGTAVLGQSLTLSVGVSGHAPFTYQWMFNNIQIPNATGPTLLIKTIKPLHNGLFWVRVSNQYGTTNSTPARLVVITNVPALTPNAPSANANALSIPTNVASVITAPVKASGHFSFQISGVAGLKYSVSATADLKNWTSVTTNTAPFTFVDTNDATYTQRFYRATYVP